MSYESEDEYEEEDFDLLDSWSKGDQEEKKSEKKKLFANNKILEVFRHTSMKQKDSLTEDLKKKQEKIKSDESKDQPVLDEEESNNKQKKIAREERFFDRYDSYEVKKFKLQKVFEYNPEGKKFNVSIGVGNTEFKRIFERKYRIKNVFFRPPLNEDSMCEPSKSLFLQFEDNTIFYRETFYTAAKSLRRDCSMFLDEKRGLHMIGCYDKFEGEYQLFYMNFKNPTNVKLKDINFNFKETADKEKLTCVGWNRCNETEKTTGHFVIGTSHLSLYYGKIIMKSRFVAKFTFLKSLAQENIPHLNNWITGINIEFKDNHYYILVTTCYQLFQFKGKKNSEEEPFKFVEITPLNKVSIMHKMSNYNTSKLSVFYKTDLKKLFTMEASTDKAGKIERDEVKYPVSMVQLTSEGILHGKLKYDEGIQDFVRDYEHLVYSDNDLDWFYNDVVSTSFPTAACLSQYHIFFLRKLKGINELGILHRPPDLSSLGKKEKLENNLLSYRKQFIEEFTDFAISRFRPKEVYLFGPYCILKITCFQENRHMFHCYFERSLEYKKFDDHVQNNVVKKSELDLQIKLTKEYFFRSLSSVYYDVINKGEMILQEMAKYAIDIRDFKKAAVWYSVTKKSVEEVIEIFLSMNQIVPLRIYLLLKYDYRKLGDVDKETEEEFTKFNFSFSNNEEDRAKSFNKIEVTSMITELYLQEINDLNEKKKVSIKNEKYEKKIQKLKVELKGFLRKARNFVDVDKIYILMTSYGHLVPAFDFSYEHGNFEKVINLWLEKEEKEFERINIFSQVLEKMNDPKVHKPIFTKFSYEIFKKNPKKFVEVLGKKKKNFLDSVNFLPSMTRYGEFLTDNFDVNEEDDKTKSVLRHTVKYYENSKDNSKDKTTKEEELVNNILIVLYSKLRNPQEFVEFSKELENDSNMEFALRRTLVKNVKFEEFTWNFTRTKLENLRLSQFGKREIKKFSRELMSHNTSGILYYKLKLNEKAVESAITASFISCRLRRNLRDFKTLRFVENAIHYANNPNVSEKREEEGDENIFKRELELLRKRLWLHLIKFNTKYHEKVGLVRKERISRKIENLTETELRETKIRNVNCLFPHLRNKTVTSIYEVFNLIRPDTTVKLFAEKLDEELKYEEVENENLFKDTSIRFKSRKKSKLAKVLIFKANQRCSSSNCQHGGYILRSNEDDKNEFFSFNCGHVFHIECLESFISKAKDLVTIFHTQNFADEGEIELKRGLKRKEEVLMLENSFRAHEDIWDMPQRLTQLRLKQINKRLDTLNKEAQKKRSLRHCFRRILKRIELKREKDEYLAAVCPLCSSITVTNVHLKFFSENEEKEWKL